MEQIITEVRDHRQETIVVQDLIQEDGFLQTIHIAETEDRITKTEDPTHVQIIVTIHVKENPTDENQDTEEEVKDTEIALTQVLEDPFRENTIEIIQDINEMTETVVATAEIKETNREKTEEKIAEKETDTEDAQEVMTEQEQLEVHTHAMLNLMTSKYN